jgi:xylulose-5-phosphate/fructose-6-phosphate phosphoketolase
MDAIRRSRRPLANAAELTERCRSMLARHCEYVAEHLDDMPEIRDWTWASR